MTGNDEAFDVLDERGVPTGERKTRHAVHRDGDWHAAIHLWIVDARGYPWLQRRSTTKDLAAGKVDVSVGGHLAAGETWQDALRESHEELGILLTPGDVTVLGTQFTERVYPNAIDREVQTVLAARVTHTLHEVHLDPAEVDAVYAAPLPGLRALFSEDHPLAVEGFDAQGRPAAALLHAGDVIEEARRSTLQELTWLAAWLDAPIPEGGAG